MSIKIESIVKDIERLPTIKTVAFEVIQLCSDKEVQIPKLVKVISGDQSLSSQILRVANSSYFNFPKTIYSLERAIVILGFNLLRDISISLSIFSVYRNFKKVNEGEMKKLWKHSIFTGFTLKSLAESYAPDKKELLYIGGLLHDLGKLALLHVLGEDYWFLLEKADREKIQLINLENQYFELDHTVVGAELSNAWKFPEAIKAMIRYHHSPEDCEFAEENALLARIVYLGNLISHMVDDKQKDLESLQKLDPKFPKYYSFTEIEFSKLLEQVRNELENNQEYLKLFGIDSK
jgi:putative nucleotidyltransferase with HDIG domain